MVFGRWAFDPEKRARIAYVGMAIASNNAVALSAYRAGGIIPGVNKVWIGISSP